MPVRSTMRILHLSELHGVDRFYEWTKTEVRRNPYDALVVSGDLLNLFYIEHIEGQIGMVRDWAQGLPAGLPVFVVSGNHDTFSLHPLLQEARWLKTLMRANVFTDGDATELGGFLFECVGWGSVPVTNSALPRIVVRHCPPALSLAGTDHLGEDLGDPELSQQLQLASFRTWLVLSGHVHEPKCWHDSGRFTCLNPGVRLDVAVPNHIVIDTDASTITRFGDGRQQTVPLKKCH